MGQVKLFFISDHRGQKNAVYKAQDVCISSSTPGNW